MKNLKDKIEINLTGYVSFDEKNYSGECSAYVDINDNKSCGTNGLIIWENIKLLKNGRCVTKDGEEYDFAREFSLLFEDKVIYKKSLKFTEIAEEYENFNFIFTNIGDAHYVTNKTLI